MNKSWGGGLPLELRKSNEYYKKDSLPLNSARYAILLALLIERVNVIYIPYYLCNTVNDVLVQNNIKVKYYHLNSSFEPILSSVDCNNIKEKKAFLLIVNYFGIFSKKKIRNLVKRYKNIILDNTQAFFFKPLPECYNVYSCRKFFGVSDGAYLIKRNIDQSWKLEQSYSSDDASFLLKILEHGTNYCYDEYLSYEQKICNQGIRKMSKLSEKIMQSIDYNSIKQIRKKNFYYMHTRLGKYNRLADAIKKTNASMVYPFLIQDEQLREYLIKNSVFVSQWWKKCLYENINEFERQLSLYLLPLPIDQGNNIEDMKFICDLIEQYLLSLK